MLYQIKSVVVLPLLNKYNWALCGNAFMVYSDVVGVNLTNKVKE